MLKFYFILNFEQLQLTFITDMEEGHSSAAPFTMPRLNSFASFSFSSGVASCNNKGLSQNLSCDSSQSNFSTFELHSDCSDLDLNDGVEFSSELIIKLNYFNDI